MIDGMVGKLDGNRLILADIEVHSRGGLAQGRWTLYRDDRVHLYTVNRGSNHRAVLHIRNRIIPGPALIEPGEWWVMVYFRSPGARCLRTERLAAYGKHLLCRAVNDKGPPDYILMVQGAHSRAPDPRFASAPANHPSETGTVPVPNLRWVKRVSSS